MFDLQAWCESNLDNGRARADGEFKSNCPFCGDETRFSINTRTAKFRCFRSSCDRYGHAAQVLSHVESITLSDAFSRFEGRDAGEDGSGASTPAFRLPSKQASAPEKLWNIPLPEHAKPVKSLALPKYLSETRKLTLETIELYELHYVHTRNIQSDYAGYVVIPVRCPNGYAFLARDATNRNDTTKRLRYKNAPGKWASDLIFGWEQAQLDGADLVIVEGAFDAMMLRQHGINALALLGKELYPNVRALLYSLPRSTRIIIMLDAGEHAATRKIADQLWARFNHSLYIAQPFPQRPNEPKIDAGNSSRELAYTAIDNARKFGE